MTTSSAVFSPGGMPGPAAEELARQIDDTPNAVYLVSLGISAPLAVELSEQMTAGTGSVSRLMALGMGPLLANAIAASIDAA